MSLTDLVFEALSSTVGTSGATTRKPAGESNKTADIKARVGIEDRSRFGPAVNDPPGRANHDSNSDDLTHDFEWGPLGEKLSKVTDNKGSTALATSGQGVVEPTVEKDNDDYYRYAEVFDLPNFEPGDEERDFEWGPTGERRITKDEGNKEISRQQNSPSNVGEGTLTSPDEQNTYGENWNMQLYPTTNNQREFFAQSNLSANDSTEFVTRATHPANEKRDLFVKASPPANQIIRQDIQTLYSPNNTKGLGVGDDYDRSGEGKKGMDISKPTAADKRKNLEPEVIPGPIRETPEKEDTRRVIPPPAVLIPVIVCFAVALCLLLVFIVYAAEDDGRSVAAAPTESPDAGQFAETDDPSNTLEGACTPADPDSGSWMTSSGSACAVLTPGNVCNLECDFGYRTPDAPAQIVCGPGRNVTEVGGTARCLPVCSRPTLPAFGQWVPSCTDCRYVQCGAMFPGEECQLECLSFANPVSGSAQVVRCTEELELEVQGGAAAECEPVRCPAPDVLHTNSVWVGNNRNPDCSRDLFAEETCDLACEQYYVLIGPLQVTCLDSGLLGYESAGATGCKFVTCTPTPPFENSLWVRPTGSPCVNVSVGQLCMLECNLGYSGAYAIFNCTEDGVGVVEAQTSNQCVEALCEAPAIPHGRLESINGGKCGSYISEGSACRLVCDPGFFPNSTATSNLMLNCTESGLVGAAQLTSCQANCALVPFGAERSWFPLTDPDTGEINTVLLSCLNNHEHNEGRDTAKEFTCTSDEGFSPSLEEAVCYPNISDPQYRGCSVLFTAGSDGGILMLNGQFSPTLDTSLNQFLQPSDPQLGIKYSKHSGDVFWIERIRENATADRYAVMVRRLSAFHLKYGLDLPDTVRPYLDTPLFSKETQYESSAPLDSLTTDDDYQYVFVAVRGQGVLRMLSHHAHIQSWVIQDTDPWHRRYGMAVDTFARALYVSVADWNATRNQHFIQRVYYTRQPPVVELITMDTNGEPRGISVGRLGGRPGSHTYLQWLTRVGELFVKQIEPRVGRVFQHQPVGFERGLYDTIGLTANCSIYHYYINRAGISDPNINQQSSINKVNQRQYFEPHEDVTSYSVVTAVDAIG